MTVRSGTFALLLFLFGFRLYAAPCDMNPGEPAQRVFAQVDAQHDWAEYKSIQAVPQLSLNGGVSAEIWMAPKKDMLVRTVAPGKDFQAYTESCYSGRGYLVYVRYELRTAWGWYYRAEGPIIMSRFHRSTEQYFDAKSNQPLVVRPQQADDFPDMLIPVLQMRSELLPFAKLLERH